MVIRGPLTELERADMDAREPLSDAERAEIRRRHWEGFEEVAAGLLPWARERASQNFKKGKLPPLAEIRQQAAGLLDELRRRGEPPGPHLVALISFLLVGRIDPESKVVPLDMKPKFQAAVRYFVDHKGASEREIAEFAAVDHHTIIKWKEQSAWGQMVHDLEHLRALGLKVGE